MDIYLTGDGNVPLSVQAMKRGAVDFLEKPIDAELLLPAIDKAIALHPRVRYVHDGRLAEMQGRFGKLSAREREVLAHVIAGRLNKQIAYDLGIAEKTVKVHRGRVMAKVGARLAGASGAYLRRIGHRSGRGRRQELGRSGRRCASPCNFSSEKSNIP